MQYQKLAEEVLGTYTKFKTLRTVFDSQSAEWHETEIDEKVEIIKRLIATKKMSLTSIINGYKKYYDEKLSNKEHVCNSLKSTLEILLPYFSHKELGYNYQEELTPKLDNSLNPFDQNLLNEIVLWKVNRYADFNSKTIAALNQIPSNTTLLNHELTTKVLKLLLKTKGVRLPMASTILRFKNPNIYQIFDQRVYRIVYGKAMPYISQKAETQIAIYLQYLNDLKIELKKYNCSFQDSDRKLYMIDKIINSDQSLKY